jgi:hypothetical protein
MKDEIVEEVRRERQQYAEQFGYDIRKIAEDIRRREQQSGRQYITLPPKKPNLSPAVQP